MADKKVQITITAAIVVGGSIVRPGTSIEVDEVLAKNLLHRDRATLTSVDVDGGKPLSEMSLKELKAEAADLDITEAEGMAKKADVIAAIEAALAE
jgi:hypothetical protein